MRHGVMSSARRPSKTATDEQQQRVEQGLDIGVGKAQRCRTLVVDHPRTLQPLQRVLRQRAVVAHLLDLK
jgi:hypothetical protein